MFELVPFSRRNNQVVNYDPFREMEEFFRMPENRLPSFATDVIDKGDSFLLNADLPGFNKEDIKLDLSDGYLTIAAERKTEENGNKPNFVKRERFYGSYRRSFGLDGIDVDRIEAEYNNGVLSINLPKEVKNPAARAIAIK